jgi:hypothetical protein
MPRYIDADKIPYVQSEDGCLDDYAFRYDINEIPAADVVELPLNIGDVVYASRMWDENGAFLPYQITCLTITQNKKKEWRRNYRAFRLINGKTIDSYVSFSFDEIGKEVFLTIEEAERYAKMIGERKEAAP